MTTYKRNDTPKYQSRQGQVARKENNRRKRLVHSGKAMWFHPLRTPDDAVKAAGL